MPKNTPMRRKDRKVTDEDAIRFILMNQEVLHLGLSDSDRIYVVPVNYAFTYEDGHLALYFHGAKAGLKYDILQEKPDVGFCIDGDQMVIPDEKDAGRFTTHYKSVVGSGRVSMIQEREEAKKALSPFYETLFAAGLGHHGCHGRKGGVLPPGRRRISGKGQLINGQRHRPKEKLCKTGKNATKPNSPSLG